MKITRVETICLSRPHEDYRQWYTSKFRVIKADCAIVVIHTDEGLRGIGEATAYGWPNLISKMVSRLSPLLVDQDPTDTTITPHPDGHSMTYNAAVSGIDCALWDLRGKIKGKRISQMLSEHPLNRIRLYASSGCRYDWRDRPEQVIEEAISYLEEGFTAYKFRIGTEWSWESVTVDRFLGLVRELVLAIDGRMELMLEGNCRLSEDQALAIGKELDRLGVFQWFEEPIAKNNIQGYSRLNAAFETPISGGESLSTVEQFLPYLENKAYSITQQDTGLCGITEAFKIAQIAHHHRVDTIPHSWHNGLMALANAHLVAALPRPRILELCMIQGPLQWDILDTKPVVENGWLELPNDPGLGVDLAEGLEDRFPYIEGHYAIETKP